MCGLVGIIAKYQSGFSNKDADTFQQMLYADAIRGWDATGVFGVTKLGNLEIKKQASAASHFVTTPQYKKFYDRMFQEYQMVVGHNRKATHGEKIHANSHPFWDEEEKICLVHNGMIGNYKEFDAAAVVDSAAIANALAEETIDTVIGNITGAFAFIWYNVEEKKLYLIRNAQRPLYVLETASTFLLASEDSMAYWIAKRNGSNITQCQDLTPMTLYSISLADRKLVEERKIEAKKTWPTMVTITPNTSTNFYPLAKTPIKLFNEDRAQYFLTTNDLPDMGTVMDKLHINDRIHFMVDSYDEIGTNAYTLTCSMLNVDREFIKVKMYVNGVDFHAMDLTEIFSGCISNVLCKDKEVVIYVRDTEQHRVVETKNHMFITDSMWMDDLFPIECLACKTKLDFPGLADCEVVIESNEVLVICTTCSGNHKHV